MPTAEAHEADTVSPAAQPDADAVSPAAGRDRAPRVLGRYHLHRQLGAGAFGTVWEASDERLQRDVAIKILPRARILGGRFEREARAAARLLHPGIVTLYEAAVDDEGAYLVSELVRGTTLERLLEVGRLSDRDIISIGIAVSDALAHAHSRGVVHRDVKPSNVLVPERPAGTLQVAKLTDFGVARVIGGDTLTRTGDVIGTAAYMAPEQAEGREAGPPADLYSLALVIYEALTGVNPVGSGTAAHRARRLGAHLPPLRRQRRDLPRELGQGIDLALRPRPRERGSIEELRAALTRVADRVEDKPGVVASAWPTRSVGTAQSGALESNAPKSHTVERAAIGASVASPPAVGVAASERRVGWGARGLAAVTAAGTSAWLASHLLEPSLIAPAAAALLAGLLVATLPRVGWLALAGATVASLLLQDRPGAGLLVLIAAVLPAVLLPRDVTTWPLSAGAPALGALGLGGAWPALAARAGSTWRRAAVGVTGWMWLAMASALAGNGLYARIPAGTPARAVWMPSLYDTVHHLLATQASAALLAAGCVWGAAAATLPVMRSRRSLTLDVVLVTVWAVALASATTGVLRMAAGGEQLVAPVHVALGTAASALVALAPNIARRWRGARNPANASA